jgi:hypothetical protein
MKRELIVWLISIFFVTISCQKSPEKIEQEYLAKAMEQSGVNHSYQWVVVLPGMGCHGCIQEGEFFMKKFIDNKEILFVLTKLSSLKILQQKLGFTIADHSNVYIDKNNTFDLPTDNRMYPCIVQLKDGKVVKHTFQSPQTNAFAQLRVLIE